MYRVYEIDRQHYAAWIRGGSVTRGSVRVVAQCATHFDALRIAGALNAARSSLGQGVIFDQREG